VISDDFDFRAAIAQERRQSRAAGTAFASACKAGDVDAFFAAVDFINETFDSWRHAMKKVGQLSCVSDEICQAFLGIWIESKMLPLAVGDRRLLANALRVLMPGTYRGAPMRLYRGASAGERRRRLYGFSWTTRIEIARDKFADQRRSFTGGAVVLETIAPADAILIVREDEDYYDEGEVVVDPFKLGRVEVNERLAG